jgi:VWFA-related protein
VAAIVAFAVMASLRGQTPRFEAGVTNIHLEIGVTRNGEAVRDLQQDDFVVRDEGESRRIVEFSKGRAPLDLVLLLDVSGSMNRDIGEMARNAASALLSIDSRDRVGVVAFSVETFLIQSFTQERSAIAEAIKRVAAKGSIDVFGTAINASIADCIGLLRSQLRRANPSGDAGRSRAILIVTDNMPEGLMPDDTIIRELLATDTILHGIVIHRSHIGSKLNFRPKTDPSAPGYTNQNVFHIAPATGGEAILSTTATQVRNALSEMLARLRSRYRIWYHAPEAPAGMFRAD